ncbi:MAG: Holliday junction branch migration protein RuvA [Bacteroidetes bacterium]|nr:MAG: Holliday junction branch migration protein RuvA [Bacteroidota bacterium]
MITHIKGRLVEKTPTYAVVDCNGVGYLINISVNTFSKIGDEEAVMLYTHFVVREDAQVLYGFADMEERRLFRHLISVSGVGPSTARMVLSSMSPEELVQAVVSGNVMAIQKVKGIGAKSAQRIIIDLRDKLAKEGTLSSDSPDAFSLDNKTLEDALSALLMLGFAKHAAEKAIGQVVKTEGSEISVEDLLKATLKIL